MEKEKHPENDSTFQASNIFDDTNSKDFGRRSMAAQQNSIVGNEHWFRADGSFKLKRIDNHKFYQQ